MTDVFSQHGEDTALREHFQSRTTGFYVEIGALDGLQYSNSAMFELTLGWPGILVEAMPNRSEECRQNRPTARIANVAVVEPGLAGRPIDFTVVEGYDALSARELTWWARRTMNRINELHTGMTKARVITVATDTIDNVLSRLGCPDEFEFMTIDIEGFELAALRGMSLGTRWRPRVLLIENGSGLIDPRLTWLLWRGGYGYRRSIAVNDWYEPMAPGPRALGVVTGGLHGLFRFVREILIIVRDRSAVLRAVDRLLLGRARSRRQADVADRSG